MPVAMELSPHREGLTSCLAKPWHQLVGCMRRLVTARGSALAFAWCHPSSLPRHKGLEPCPGATAAVTQRRRYKGEKCRARCIGGRVGRPKHGASVFLSHFFGARGKIVIFQPRGATVGWHRAMHPKHLPTMPTCAWGWGATFLAHSSYLGCPPLGG